MRRSKRRKLIINRSSSFQTMMEPRSPLITIRLGGLLQIKTQSGAMRPTGGCRRTLGMLSMWPS